MKRTIILALVAISAPSQIAHSCASAAQENSAAAPNATATILPSLAPATPESVLPNNVDSRTITNPFTGEVSRDQGRKGTVGAALINVALLDKLFTQSSLSADENKAIFDIFRTIGESAPVLRSLGMFDIFDYAEWLQLRSPHSWGRICVALITLNQATEAVTMDVQRQLELLLQSNPPQVVREKLLMPLLKLRKGN